MMAQSTPKKKPRLIGRQASGFLTQLEQILMSPTETVNTARLYAAEFREDFPVWLHDNYPIYAEFERQALNIAARRDRYSARTILEVMRHNSAISESGGHFKLNNNRAPCMARLFSIMHPEHAGFFQLRDSDARLGLAA